MGHHLENPRHIDVDHHVPLKNAHLSGGWAWDAGKKEDYANYLEDPARLGGHQFQAQPEQGRPGPRRGGAPPDASLWCGHTACRAEVKKRRGPMITPVESESVMDMLRICEDSPDLEVETLHVMGGRIGEHKATAELQETVYESCEEAAAAGEERVQGSQGGRRGFPKAMVPSAKDGDRDGVVCEN